VFDDYHASLWMVKCEGTKLICKVSLGELTLRVLDCVVTVSFGVCLVLWLFELVL